MENSTNYASREAIKQHFTFFYGNEENGFALFDRRGCKICCNPAYTRLEAEVFTTWEAARLLRRDYLLQTVWQQPSRALSCVVFAGPKSENLPYIEFTCRLLAFPGEGPGNQLALLKARPTSVKAKEDKHLPDFTRLAATGEDLLALHHSDGSFEWVSDAFYQQTGYTTTELADKRPCSLLPPDQLQTIYKAWKAVNTGHTASSSVRLKAYTKSGDVIWLHTIFKLLPAKNGRQQQVFSASRKITDWVWLKNLLTTTEEVAGIGGWYLNTVENSIIFTKGACLLLNLPPGQQSSVNEFLQNFEEDSAEKLKQKLQQAAGQAHYFDIEATLKPGKSGPRILRLIAQPTDQPGETDTIYGSLQDITEIKKYQAKLKYHDYLLQGINHASGKLLTVPDFRQSIAECLAIAGKTFATDQICLFVYSSTENTFKLKENWLPRQKEHYRQHQAVFQHFMQSLGHYLPDLKAGKTLVHQQQSSEHLHILQHLLLPVFTGERFWGIFTFVRGNEQNWQEEETRLLRNLANATGGAIARHMAEKQLQQSEANLKSVFDSSVQAWYLLDNNCRIVNFNRLANEYSVQLFDEQLQRGDSIFNYNIPGGDIEEFRQHYQQCLQGEIIKYEKKMPVTEEKSNWFELSYLPVYNKNRQITGVSFSSLEITRRKADEARLKMLALVAENTNNSVIITNEKGLITYVNKGFTRITGYSFEEINGQKPGNFLQGPETDAPTVQAMGAAIRNHQDFACNIVNYNKNGNSYWGHLVINPLKEPCGNVFGFISILTDISENISIARKLAEQNQELASTNQELDWLVYCISHDLRAPLASILGLVEVANIEENIADIHTCLGKITEYVERLDNFIHEIMDYSRNKRLEVDYEAIDLEKVVADIIDSLYYMQHQRNITVTTRFSHPGKAFMADARRLKIMLANLLSNAIKYANPAQERPRVEVQLTCLPGSYVLQVADNGVGIEKQYIDRIFEMFYQADKHAVGSGLGLYIVAQAVKKLKGSIEVRSERWKGTCFTVTLPAEAPAETMPASKGKL